MQKISTEPTQSKPPLLTNAELAGRIDHIVVWHELATYSLSKQNSGGEKAIETARIALREIDRLLVELLEHYNNLLPSESASAPKHAVVYQMHLLDTANTMQALSKTLASWLSNHGKDSEYGELDPDQGDMVALSALLASECGGLVKTLDNPALVVEVRS